MIKYPLFYRMRIAEYLTFTARIYSLIMNAVSDSITMEPFKGRIEKSKIRLEESGKKVNTQLLTINVTDCDSRRDQSMIAFTGFAEACSKRLNTTVSGAGKAILNEIGSYGSGIIRRPMLEESAILLALFAKINNSPFLTDCLQQMRGEQWLEELEKAEQDFTEAVEERGNAKLDRNAEISGEMCKEIRNEFEAFFKYLDVMCDLNSDVAYAELVKEINIVSEETNAILLQRAGRNSKNDGDEIGGSE
ncbi:DUF6261 family protein [Labilibaculum antarcticum]|uniref:Uncharacterized protein n=1 Tax=Labilibaculum antarcticum TaxID=1717717 RepID=A0A1Y1CEQ2_9BACT|nr:DUF6261 family protein [Labilibaculum antarcticum]BAX78502.1 hypothetical protein ALGA_0107 [Labilibaculum antarcticum]